MPVLINEGGAAPLARIGKHQATAHLKVTIAMQNVGAPHIFGSVSRKVDEALQFIDRRQPPIRISRQSQFAAILHCLVPAPPFAAIFRGPHEAIGRIDPVPTCLSSPEPRLELFSRIDVASPASGVAEPYLQRCTSPPFLRFSTPHYQHTTQLLRHQTQEQR